MKTIIAGSRSINDAATLHAALAASGFADAITEVFSGGARGVDALGEAWADARGLPVRRFVPDWNAAPRHAGLLRNAEMAAQADALIAVWDGASRGTAHMIQTAQQRGLRVYVHKIKADNEPQLSLLNIM